MASELGCIGTQGSVTSVEDIDRTVQIAVDSFGRIDLVVNNTGHAATGEVGATVAFLASAGGAYITGQNLRVDGGLARPI